MVQIYNLYIQYVNNSISTCFTCGDKTAREHLATLEQIYMEPPKQKELTINDASFQLKANIDFIKKDLCAFCGAKDGLIESDMIGINVRVKVCKTKCGYTKK